MRYFATILTVLTGLAMTGCSPSGVDSGSGSNGNLGTTVGAGTAPYALLDLQTRTISYRATLSDIAGNAAYRDRIMVFKRVGTGTSEVLIGVFTVTQAQWVRLDGSTPWTAIPTTVVACTPDDALPAYGLDYDSIVPALVAFPIVGARLAVPTAAQYETAVGASSGWSWGQTTDHATLAANAVVRETTLSESNKSTRLDVYGNDIGGPGPVGMLAPNSNGIYDLHGNVWQWLAPGNEVCGGSWYDPASLARVEVRSGVGQGLASDVPHALIGLRLTLVLQ